MSSENSVVVADLEPSAIDTSFEVHTDWLVKNDDGTFARFPNLTERERLVALMLALGKRNKDIASLLSITPKTVDTHRGRLLKKVNCRNNVELARYAIRMGYLEP
ncbi:MAG: response regulator transcription factor [Kofleriaceae bacterium]